jgi:serine phosphatase RsbU (regulator of sigma subunit)
MYAPELSLQSITSAPRSSLTALIVDDDEFINELLGHWLHALGFHTEHAASGAEALERLCTVQADLLLLDVYMPGISGLEVLERIRSQSTHSCGEDMAIIIMTASSDAESPVTALRHRADDYVRKPLTPDEFMLVVKRVMTRLQLMRQNAELNRQLAEKHRQLETELARASQVQANLLPATTPTIPGFELAARCIPARNVGGDFYDWHMPTPGRLNLTLGDVMGKGMPAALMMTTVRAVVRAVARQTPPHMNIHYARAALEPDLDREGSFVTMFHAQLNVEQRQLTYIDAGHGLSFLWRADGTVESLPERGLPLGILAEEVYAEGCLAFQPGDALILYSDGLVDARVDLGLEPAVLARHLDGATDAQAMVTALVDLVGSVSALPDDLTVVVLRCLPA